MAVSWHQGEELRIALCRQPDSARGGVANAMKLLSTQRSTVRAVPTIVQQRWRWAALAGVVLFLAPCAVAISVRTPAHAGAPTPNSFLAAARGISARLTSYRA